MSITENIRTNWHYNSANCREFKERHFGEKYTMKIFALTAILALALLSGSCESPGEPGPERVIRENGRVYIVDRVGQEWDVTSAEEKYNMKADEFQFGIGKNAIRPISDPQFIHSGISSFPDTDATFLVMGVSLNGDDRAYPIDVMSRHEVVTEKFADAHVSVAY